MNLFAGYALMIAGGAGASYVDREYGAKYDQHFTVGTQPITITVGAMFSLAAALGLALVPGGSASAGKLAAASLIGGGLVYEGIKATETQVLPALGIGPAVVAPPAAIAAPAVVQGLPYGRHPTYPDYQVQGGLVGYPR